jgi:PPK2 family polyphosphate:nucleotide phosphotransferase
VAEQSGRKTGKRKGAKKRERERKAIKAVKRAALAKRADAKAEAPAAKTKTRKAVPGASPATTVANLLRVGPDFDLAAVDPASTPGLVGDRKDAEAALAARTDELADLQERLYAAGRGGGNRALLLVIQGMDTSGKGGIMRHVVGSMDPQGVKLTSFKAPTAEEREKGYLWRIRQALPAPGYVGVFDRSHYEDVLIVRVHNLVAKAVWSRRYSGINQFEKKVVESGTAIVKVMLHISEQEQKRRLAERIERPDKFWKYNPGDIDERSRWADYQEAYSVALSRCSTDEAPWYVVPADHKWYSQWAVQQLVLNALREIDPQWPPAHFDPAEESARLAAT